MSDGVELSAISNFDTLPPDRVFTYRYRQPNDYHFCLDSILFSGFVATEIRKRWPNSLPADFRALDVCAGCGVIGFEISHSFPEILNFDFVEIQDAFRESFEENLRQARELSPRTFRFLQVDYRDLARPDAKEQYDLIVGNPPYFFEGEGPLSPSTLRNRCRFFLDGNLRDLVEGTVNALKRDGVGFLLIKTGTRHGRDVVCDLQTSLAARAELAICASVRGTSVLRVARASL